MPTVSKMQRRVGFYADARQNLPHTRPKLLTHNIRMMFARGLPYGWGK